jgi:hypothetical protein
MMARVKGCFSCFYRMLVALSSCGHFAAFWTPIDRVSKLTVCNFLTTPATNLSSRPTAELLGPDWELKKIDRGKDDAQ